MSPRRVRPVIALVVCLAMCAGCYGRNHIQHEGSYAFTAQQITRDDCGLQQGTALWSGDMLISGDLIRIQMDDRLYGMVAVGRFLYGVEAFTFDGTATGVTVQVTGTNCQVDMVQAHVDATTDSATAFHGTSEVGFRTDQINCACHLAASYIATMQ